MDIKKLETRDNPSSLCIAEEFQTDAGVIFMDSTIDNRSSNEAVVQCTDVGAAQTGCEQFDFQPRYCLFKSIHLVVVLF